MKKDYPGKFSKGLGKKKNTPLFEEGGAVEEEPKAPEAAPKAAPAESNWAKPSPEVDERLRNIRREGLIWGYGDSASDVFGSKKK